ncbi:MAG: hypothetical protein NZ585_07360 [Chloracidobacterium sp.]|nr:hypothetical protein [Chloracidobacterium sp.]MDW8217075.1 hypothetical protein [Acidobacteriota bacterium]
MNRLFRAIKAAVLWKYERGTWQYDVLCCLILAFIFLIPSSWFDERPAARRRAAAYLGNSGPPEFISTAELGQAPPSETLQAALERVGEARWKRPVRVRHFEHVNDVSGERIAGYHVWFEALEPVKP